MKHYREWIPQTVRALRGELTLKELSERSGLSISHLSDIERGQANVTLETLDKIFTACGVTLTLGFEAQDSNFKRDWILVKKETLREIQAMVRKIIPDDEIPF